MTVVSEIFKNNQPSPPPGMTVVSGFLVSEDLVDSVLRVLGSQRSLPVVFSELPSFLQESFSLENQCGEVWCCVHTQVISGQCSLSAVFLDTLLLVFLSGCSVGCCHDSLLCTNRAQPHVRVAGTYFSSLGACALVSVPCCTGFCYIWTVAGGFLYFIYLVCIDSLLWTVNWGCFVCS